MEYISKDGDALGSKWITTPITMVEKSYRTSDDSAIYTPLDWMDVVLLNPRFLGLYSGIVTYQSTEYCSYLIGIYSNRSIWIGDIHATMGSTSMAGRTTSGRGISASGSFCVFVFSTESRGR